MEDETEPKREVLAVLDYFSEEGENGGWCPFRVVRVEEASYLDPDYKLDYQDTNSMGEKVWIPVPEGDEWYLNALAHQLGKHFEAQAAKAKEVGSR